MMSSFTASSANVVTSILLIEIGASFGVSVGIAGQIRTLSYTVAIISSILLGALSLRYTFKSLLLIGLLTSIISALGSGLSFNFNMMLISYSLNGIAMSMILPMVFSLVAEYFSIEKRPSIIGLLIASQVSSATVGSLVASYISEVGGWRVVFLGYIFPVALLSLILVFKMLPTIKHANKLDKINAYDGFKKVLSHKSALACLIGFAFSASAFQAIATYSASFYRQKFHLSTGFTATYFIAASICFIIGSLSSGRLVNRFGRKSLAAFSVLLAGIFSIFFTNVPIVTISMAIALVSTFFNGMRNAAANNLTLEQVPQFRGVMMSLYSVADNLGMAFGAGIGGYMIFLYDYNVMGAFLGSLGIISAIIFHFFTEDPTTNN
jgi:DHA1 family putative efflux transporter-like MFS transporter